MATEMIQEAVHPPWLLLDCAVQNYAWGKKGSSSVVAKLRKSEEDFVVDPNTPYAEVCGMPIDQITDSRPLDLLLLLQKSGNASIIPCDRVSIVRLLYHLTVYYPHFLLLWMVVLR